MSRTRRFYNKPNNILSVYSGNLGFVPCWHPWKVIWNNKGCLHEELMTKRRRFSNKIEIKRELLNLCPYYNLVGKNECFNCLMRWYDEDCGYINEIEIFTYKEHKNW